MAATLMAACVFPAWGQAIIPVNRHLAINDMPLRSNDIDCSTPLKKASDNLQDLLPSSVASWYYSVTAGNTYGNATIASKSNWLTSALDWVNNKVANFPGGTDLQRGTAQNENMLTWLDDIVFPELTMRSEQTKAFQRMMKGFQLFRQMQVMSKSFSGSLFKIDLLDLLPVFEQVYLDDFGMPSNGVRVGLRYKDSEDQDNILAAFGLDNPHLGPWDTPRLRYKGPQKFDDIGFKIEASPYQDVEVGSGALRIGQKGNEILDRVFFEGMMGRHMANGGVYYTTRADLDRPSPKLLKKQAENCRDIRIKQILDESEAWAKAYNIDPADALVYFQEELNYWDSKPGAIYDNQMRRLNRLRDEVQPIQNDTVKLESPEHLKEESDPDRKNFLDNLFNLYTQLNDSVGEVYNAATGNEDDGDNPGPRLLYKANVDYAKATHAAYLETLAIRRYLAAKIQAEAQRGASDGFYNLWRDMEDRKRVLAREEVRAEDYRKRANKVIDLLEKMGLYPDDIHAMVQGGGVKNAD